MLKEVNENNFIEVINKDFVLIDFFAEWCGPCKMLHPILVELSNEIDIPIYECNVDRNNSIAMRYQINSIPTLLLFKKGQNIAVIQGYRPKQHIIDFINKNK